MNSGGFQRGLGCVMTYVLLSSMVELVTAVSRSPRSGQLHFSINLLHPTEKISSGEWLSPDGHQKGKKGANKEFPFPFNLIFEGPDWNSAGVRTSGLRWVVALFRDSHGTDDPQRSLFIAREESIFFRATLLVGVPYPEANRR